VLKKTPKNLLHHRPRSHLLKIVCILQEEFYGKTVIIADREMVEMVSPEALSDTMDRT